MLRVLSRGRPNAVVGPIALCVGASAERVIVLGDGTLVPGHLLDARSARVAGTAVVLEGVDEEGGLRERQEARTGADSRFVFEQRCPEVASAPGRSRRRMASRS